MTATIVAPGAVEGDWIAVEFHPGLVKEPECDPQEAHRPGHYRPPGYIRCRSPILAGGKPVLQRIEDMR